MLTNEQLFEQTYNFESYEYGAILKRISDRHSFDLNQNNNF
jgi:hypothetical protein